MARLFNSRRLCVPSLGSQARLGQEHKGDLQKECCTIALRGDRADLHKLVAQLQEREATLRDQRSKAFASAQRLFEAGDAKAAMEQVAPLSSGLTPSQIQFKELVKGAAWHEDELSRLLASAKADGTITADEVVLLANQTVRCLQMNPRHDKITALLWQLIDRIERKPMDYVNGMKALMPLVKHLREIGKIPVVLNRLAKDHENAVLQEKERRRLEATARSSHANYNPGPTAHYGTPKNIVVCPRCSKSIPSRDLGPHLSKCRSRH